MIKILFLSTMIALGCAGISGPKNGEQAFLYAQALYRDQLAVAASFSADCVMQPSVDCAELVRKLDDINKQAQLYILAGQLILDGSGSLDVSCDEEASPGCTERLLEARLFSLASQLQAVTARLVAD